MTQRSVTHAIFTLERTYPHAPQRVYDAFATYEGKASWFYGQTDKWDLVEQSFDFREGGEERLVGRWATGRVSDFHARYLDIVPGERIDRYRDGIVTVDAVEAELRPYNTPEERHHDAAEAYEGVRR